MAVAKAPQKKLSAGALRYAQNHPGKFRNGSQQERRAAGLGPVGAHPGSGHMHPTPPAHPGNGHLPAFPGQGQAGGGQQQGWEGLQGVMDMLNGGLSSDQVANLGKGFTGGNGYSVGGAHGAFKGLSPYAAHWLATSGLLQQDDPTKGAGYLDQTGLTGSDLAFAQQKDALLSAQPQQYHLQSGISQDQLGQLLGLTQGGGYAQGFGAAMPNPQLPGGGSGMPPIGGGPFHPPVARRPVANPRRPGLPGPVNGVYQPQ